MKKYDAIIIGAGQAGVPLAKKLAAAGWKTVLIEKRFIGGTCINDGCTPTKTMISSGRIAHLVSKSKEWGIMSGNYTVDMRAIKKRKDDIVISSRNGSKESLEKIENLDLLFGEAIFTNSKQLAVTLKDGTTMDITAEKIFIDTGGKPQVPEIEGIGEVPYLTSTTILDLQEVPESLLIIGSGYIALEFGQLYQRLGAGVTILESSATFLKKEDDDVAGTMKQILQEDGVTIHLNAVTKKLQNAACGKIEAIVSINNLEQTLICTHLLVAAGRTPQTRELQLDKAGITTDKKGYILVNDELETNIPGIYALGDVKGGPEFTHISYNDFVVVYRNLVQHAGLSIKDRLIPYCMFTDPQLGRVGITEKEARQKGLNIKVAALSMDHVARARETNETRGFMKAIVDANTKKILGAAVIGVEGGEIMSVLQMAMMGGITYDQIRYAIFAHPTFSESLNNLFMSLQED